MAETKLENQVTVGSDPSAHDERHVPLGIKQGTSLYQFYTHPWFQVCLIGFICFCLPGMYNALSGLGGSGQVDSTVAANASVALLAATASTALFVVGPLFKIMGPMWSLIVGGWTYALYSGSLLCYNHTQSAAFVIASGGILGVGTSFLWIAQGAIMTTYVPEHQKGRSIAVFWVIFNLGGSVGSFVSLGLNYNSTAGTVGDSTYIAFLVIMAFGWALSFLICRPSQVNMSQIAVEEERPTLKSTIQMWTKTVIQFRVLCMLPLFFCANVFYSYQQNTINGKTFTLRARSLNGALYWFAQIFGGLLIGFVLDMPRVSRPVRAKIGWAILFVYGMVLWGGSYAFQKWENRRLDAGLIQDIDFTDHNIYIGPMFLYIFSGGFDALWQGYCYWLIGAASNNTAIAAVLVGAYKTFQATGGAMAWRVNAVKTPFITELAMNWGLSIGSLIIAVPAVWTVTMTSVENPDIIEEISDKDSSRESV